MKHFTSIEQSKKLLELGLSPDSADMVYRWVPFMDFKDNQEPVLGIMVCDLDIPCWSLAALLSVLPNYQLQTQDDGIGILCSCNGNFNIITANSAVDACYEMIIKLH